MVNFSESFFIPVAHVSKIFMSMCVVYTYTVETWPKLLWHKVFLFNSMFEVFFLKQLSFSVTINFLKKRRRKLGKRAMPPSAHRGLNIQFDSAIFFVLFISFALAVEKRRKNWDYVQKKKNTSLATTIKHKKLLGKKSNNAQIYYFYDEKVKTSLFYWKGKRKKYSIE